MERSDCVTLTANDMSVYEDDGMHWLFLKVIGKRADKREMDEHLWRAWGCKAWICI